jgi:hypothetical protein
MLCVKAITVRFHLSHPAEKQAWEKLNARRSERHQSFSQLVAEAVNACGTEGVHLSGTEKIELVQEITESVTSGLQRSIRRISPDTPLERVRQLLWLYPLRPLRHRRSPHRPNSKKTMT